MNYATVLKGLDSSGMRSPQFFKSYHLFFKSASLHACDITIFPNDITNFSNGIYDFFEWFS